MFDVREFKIGESVVTIIGELSYGGMSTVSVERRGSIYEKLLSTSYADGITKESAIYVGDGLMEIGVGSADIKLPYIRESGATTNMPIGQEILKLRHRVDTLKIKNRKLKSLVGALGVNYKRLINVRESNLRVLAFHECVKINTIRYKIRLREGKFYIFGSENAISSSIPSPVDIRTSNDNSAWATHEASINQQERLLRIPKTRCKYLVIDPKCKPTESDLANIHNQSQEEFADTLKSEFMDLTNIEFIGYIRED